jgi:hypothetical protein
MGLLDVARTADPCLAAKLLLLDYTNKDILAR